MPDSKSDIAEMSFEQAFDELEAIVRDLESGDLPLEEALQAFERGQRLAAHGQELLDQAEQVLIELTDDSDRDADQTREDE